MNTKPFDIRLARAGHPVVTALGDPVQIVKYDCRGPCPLLALIRDAEHDDAAFFDEQGRDSSGHEALRLLDRPPHHRRRPDKKNH